MARPGGVPITRLRFVGRTDVLKRMCRAFREHPNVSMTADEVAEHSRLPFREVYQRLTETPELFVRLIRSKGGDPNSRYRLASALAAKDADGVASFIDKQRGIEARIAAIIVLGFIALVIFSTLMTDYSR